MSKTEALWTLISKACRVNNDPLPRIAPRIVLRRLRLADLAKFQAYRCDPDVGRYQSWSPMSPADAAAFLQEMSAAVFCTPGQWFQFGIAERSTDQLIGDIGVCIRDSEHKDAELGFALSAASQGQGLGSEAVLEALAMLFETTDIARVVAVTDARNHASIRLLQRVGMKLTETLDSVFRGERCEEHVFAISAQGAPSRHAAHPSIIAHQRAATKAKRADIKALKTKQRLRVSGT